MRIRSIMSLVVGNVMAAMSSIELSPTSTLLNVCDYSTQIASAPIGNPGLPCSTIYSPALVQGGFSGSKRIRVLVETDKLRAVPAKTCFRLELVTECIQRWFTSNEIKRYTNTLSMTRADCLGDSACLGCEIANSYLPEQCEVFTFGANIAKKTITFANNALVYADGIGRYYFGSSSTTNDFFDVGGTYNSYTYFDKPLPQTPIQMDVVFDPTSYKIIILSEKMLLNWSNQTSSVFGEDWLVYGSTLASKADLLRSNRLLATSQQEYAEFFLQAQQNVTEWYLNYLDCRLKSLTMTLARSNKAISDLGPGEVYEDEMLTKYKCKSVTVGSVAVRNGCLVYKYEENISNITSNGEITLSNQCVKALRINKTHVLNINSPSTLEIRMYSYSLLSEEENILRYPPIFTRDISEIYNLIRESSIVHTRSGTFQSTQEGAKTTTTTTSMPLTWIQRTSQSSTWSWVTFAWVILSMIAIGYILYYILKPWLAIKKMLSKPDQLNEDGMEITDINTK